MSLGLRIWCLTTHQPIHMTLDTETLRCQFKLKTKSEKETTSRPKVHAEENLMASSTQGWARATSISQSGDARDTVTETEVASHLILKNAAKGVTYTLRTRRLIQARKVQPMWTPIVSQRSKWWEVHGLLLMLQHFLLLWLLQWICENEQKLHKISN